MPWFFGSCCYASELGPEVNVEQTSTGDEDASVKTWHVALEKAKWGKLGMEISQQENVLKVEQLQEDGAIVDFNTSFPKQAIEAGDYIIEVNGIKGVALQMLAEARDVESLSMKMCRTRTFQVDVKKTGPLGVTFGVFSKVLVVQAINDGPIQDWNRRNPTKVLEPGDQIQEVNGIKDVSHEVLDALKKDGDLLIKVLPLGGAGFKPP